MSCPAWCTKQHEGCAEHWGEPDTPDWPEIRVTGDPELDGDLLVAPYPRWCEGDGLAPTVCVYMTGDDYDQDFHLTPAEARAMAEQLFRAAALTEAVGGAA